MIAKLLEAAVALPPPMAGINVNFCKNPACHNFGVLATLVKWRRKANTDLASRAGNPIAGAA